MQWHTRLHNLSLSIEAALNTLNSSNMSNISKSQAKAAAGDDEQSDNGQLSHGAYSLQKEALVLLCSFCLRPS
jgi:hypothetical protein